MPIWIFFFVAIFAVVQNYSHFEKEVTQIPRESATGLALTQTWYLSPVTQEIAFDSFRSQCTSFEGPGLFDQDQKRDGAQSRSMEVSLLQAYGQRCGQPMRWMSPTLDAMRGFILRSSTSPQVAADGLCRRMDRDPVEQPRLWMDRWARQVSKATDAEPQTKTTSFSITTEVPVPAGRGELRQRQRQSQRKRKLCALATIYAMVVPTFNAISSSDRGYLNESSGIPDAIFELTASDAAVPQAQSSQRKLRACLFEIDVQGAEGQAEFARRCPTGRQECRGYTAQSRCEVAQAAHRPAQDSTQKAVRSGRTMGSLPCAMGILHRESLTTLAVSCGRLRIGRKQIRREKKRHAAASSRDTASSQRSAFTHYGTGIRRRWCRHGDCAGGPRSYETDRGARDTSFGQRLHADQEGAHWGRQASQGHDRRQNQRTRSVKITIQKGARRCRGRRASRQKASELRLASCLRASFEEASFACDTAVRRAMRRSADRFCKLTFWPTVEIEGELPAWHSRNCNFWHDSSNFDRGGRHELHDVPFSEVLPAHSVFEEPDFSSAWDAREKALILESSLHLHLFEVDFDPKSKWWIKTNDMEGHQLDDSWSSVCRTHGQYADAPEFNQPIHDQPDLPPIDPFGLWHADLLDLPEWWSRLRTLRQRHGLLEVEEEGSIIYFCTWYLHGQTQRRCDQPRTVRLDQNWDMWLDTIRDRWSERIDFTQPVHIGVVSPDPPSNVFQGHVAHLILAQEVQHESVGVVTAYFRSTRIDALQQSAQFLAPLVTFDDAIDAIPARVQCEVRQCRAYLGDLPLVEDAPLPTRLFTALTVEVFPYDDDIDDFSSFMDRGVRSPSRDPGASSSHQTAAVRDVNYEFFQQLRRHLGAQPEHVTGGQHFRIRTWYLHFSEVLRWTQPREIDLSSTSADWSHVLRTAWSDHVRPHEDTCYHFVLPGVPDLPRAPGDVILADVIVTQGQQNLRGGLATFYLPNVDYFYHVAIALPVQTSGIDILQAGQVQHLLSAHHCFINHGWSSIPVTSQPTHSMQHGHSFTVHFAGHHLHAPGEVIEEPVNIDTQTLASVRTDDDDETDQQSSNTEGGAESFESEIWASDDEVMEGVQVYSLGKPSRHFFVRWTTYNAVLMDVVRQLQIRLRDVIGVHYLATSTVDQHAAEEGLILQYVNDIPIGSLNKLVLIDIELRYHESSPTVDRQVHQLSPRISRTSLLHRLHFFDYCEIREHQCHLFWSNVEWSPDDDQLYDVQHGLYLRVVIPPPTEQIDDETFAREVNDLLVDSDHEASASNKRSLSSCSADTPLHAGAEGASKAMRLLQHVLHRFKIALHQLDDFDDLALMQRLPHSRPTSPSLPVDPSSSSNVHACAGFMFNVDAPIFQPGLLVVMQQSRFVQDLHAIWTQAAFAWEGEDETTQVATWFVSHHLPFPRCQHPRQISLNEDVTNWESAIIAAWHDHVVPGAPITFQIVDPPPPHLEPGIPAHILVVQYPHEHLASSLVTIYDRDWHPEDGPYT